MKRRHDERDLIFSRVRLEKGTKAYEDYYREKPHLREGDDAVRGKTLRPRSKKDSAVLRRLLALLERKSNTLASLYDHLEATPLGPTRRPFESLVEPKTSMRRAGAVALGYVELNETHYYSHHGGLSTALGLENRGQPVSLPYTYAIAFLVRIDRDGLNCSPRLEGMLATEEAYLTIASIGAAMAIEFKKRGYESVFASEAYYPGPLVPLGMDAGLGEIGMANHLVHPVYGNAVRIGAVYTTYPLKPDTPRLFSLAAFCKRCALCLMNCPSKSIKPHPRIVNGRTHYKMDDQTCHAMWFRSGTDCAVCLKSCPFSQGVDEADIEKMQKDPELIDAIVEKHIKKHGRQPRCRPQEET